MAKIKLALFGLSDDPDADAISKPLKTSKFHLVPDDDAFTMARLAELFNQLP